MKKILKKISCLFVCMAILSSFSMVAFAGCEAPVVENVTSSCIGNTCYMGSAFAPTNRVMERGYQICYDSYGKPVKGNYANDFNQGCC